MADSLREYSVTKDDEGNVGGVIRLMMYPQATRTGIPPYWSIQRDLELRRLNYSEFHEFWAGAVAIAITKMAALGWDLESSQPRVRNYYHGQLGDFFATEMPKLVLDYLTTDNGCFIEVVRAGPSVGARVLGLLHLDSLRCTRTGNDDTPVLYRDALGKTHQLMEHQVIQFADMPSATYTYYGVGYCAESRALGAIYKMEAIEKFIYEKVSGNRALALDLIGGVLPKHIKEGIQGAKEDNEARGNSAYLGAVMIPVPSQEPITHVRIPFAELPDGFDYDKQINNAILTYANALGMDVQDLQPLTGRPLGSGAQSEILDDKAKGKGLILFRRQLTWKLNTQYLPDSVNFVVTEKDVRDQQRKATLFSTYTSGVAQLVTSGILTPDEAKQILADNDVIPQEFVPVDTTPVEAISGDEKPTVEDDAQEEAPAPAEETPVPQEEKGLDDLRLQFAEAMGQFKQALQMQPVKEDTTWIEKLKSILPRPEPRPQDLTIPVTVNVPPAVVTVAPAPAPEVTVNVPKQDLPVINVSAPVVTVKAPPVTVATMPTPVVNVAVNPTPVTVANTITPTQVTTVDVVERDSYGRIQKVERKDTNSLNG